MTDEQGNTKYVDIIKAPDFLKEMGFKSSICTKARWLHRTLRPSIY